MKKRKKKVKESKLLQFVVQLGNFVIKRHGDGEFGFIRVSTVDGSWRMDFREDTFKYSWILFLANDEKYHDILQSWIVISYHVTMCTPDPQFLEEVIKKLHELEQRMVMIMTQQDGEDKNKNEVAE